MINTLDNSNSNVANKIHTIFQTSYKVEAQLIGIADFPPLSRTINDIECSLTQFYGFTENGSLAAVLEVDISDKILDICSLTVDPKFFKKGIASKLLSYVLTQIEFSEAKVETAAVNIPALTLYKKYGFVEFKRWVPSHGIQKVAMSFRHIEQ